MALEPMGVIGMIQLVLPLMREARERRDRQRVFARRTKDSSAFLGAPRDEIRGGGSDRSLAV